jgi:hypothetical protein
VKSTRLMIVFGACVAAGALWPAEAAAQRSRGGSGAVARTRPVVVVRGGSYRPYYSSYYRPYYGGYYGSYYRPYYYSPFYSGVGFGFGLSYGLYSGFYAPFYAGYGYGGYPYSYAQYGYPRGYYGYGGAWASARLEVKPRDAQVFVDGYLVGNVDQFDGVFQRLDLPTGEHEIAIYQRGYRAYRQRTLFRPGESYHFKAILEPLPAGAPEEPQPQPAASRPDPYTDPNREPRDPRDPYTRDPYARDPGQDPNRQPPPQPGDPGRTTPMPDRPGDRRAPQGGFGTLNVRVQPGDAVIVIDGERWDSPEAGSRLSVQLAPGSHRVEVRKDGFKPYSSTVQIHPGESQALNISLPQGQ